MVNEATSKKLSIILSAIVFLLVIVSIIYSPIYGDEGVYHGEAHGKNIHGYYTSPYLYDIPAFQGLSYLLYPSVNSTAIQTYRHHIYGYSLKNPACKESESIVFCGTKYA